MNKDNELHIVVSNHKGEIKSEFSLQTENLMHL